MPATNKCTQPFCAGERERLRERERLLQSESEGERGEARMDLQTEDKAHAVSKEMYVITSSNQNG